LPTLAGSLDRENRLSEHVVRLTAPFQNPIVYYVLPSRLVSNRPTNFPGTEWTS